MKSPLRYQITEFDCGTVSLTNCISYLFDRENIPAELIKSIHMYTLDCYDDKGNLGQGGTSRQAIEFLSKWIENFCKARNFGVECEYLKGKSVSLETIKECILKGGCVNLRTYLECEHYVMITDYDEYFVYIFDPYYLEADEYGNSKDILIVDGDPIKYNRKISYNRFLSEKAEDFALGPIEKRECVLLYRT